MDYKKNGLINSQYKRLKTTGSEDKRSVFEYEMDYIK